MGLINFGLCFALIGGVWKLTHGEMIFKEGGRISTYVLKPGNYLFKSIISFLSAQARAFGITDFLSKLTEKLLVQIKNKIGITKMMSLIEQMSTMLSSITTGAVGIAKEVGTTGTGLVKTGVNVAKQAASVVINKAGATSYLETASSIFGYGLASIKGIAKAGYEISKQGNTNIPKLGSANNIPIITNDANTFIEHINNQQFVNQSFKKFN